MSAELLCLGDGSELGFVRRRSLASRKRSSEELLSFGDHLELVGEGPTGLDTLTTLGGATCASLGGDNVITSGSGISFTILGLASPTGPVFLVTVLGCGSLGSSLFGSAGGITAVGVADSSLRSAFMYAMRQ